MYVYCYVCVKLCWFILQELRVDPTGASGNSMSMLRAPDPESSIKGSSSNFPFWPGGLDMPQQDDVNLVEEEWKGKNV